MVWVAWTSESVSEKPGPVRGAGLFRAWARPPARRVWAVCTSPGANPCTGPTVEQLRAAQVVGGPTNDSPVTALPFRGADAVRRGLVTRNDLRLRFRRIFRDVYIERDAEVTAAVKANAAWLAAGPHITLAGVSAAAVFGTRWLNAHEPVEIIRADRHHCPGMVAHSWELAAGDVGTVGEMRVTSPARTAFDIGRTRPANIAIPIVDALLNATRCSPSEVRVLAATRAGVRGVSGLRRVLELVDGGAESPQETRLRLTLVRAGLPRPETQIEFFDECGYAFIRVDMGWREWKVAVEYDGVQHWTDRRQRSWDIDRIAILESMGWSVVRVSAEMMSRPGVTRGAGAGEAARRGVSDLTTVGHMHVRSPTSVHMAHARAVGNKAGGPRGCPVYAASHPVTHVDRRRHRSLVRHRRRHRP